MECVQRAWERSVRSPNGDGRYVKGPKLLDMHSVKFIGIKYKRMDIKGVT